MWTTALARFDAGIARVTQPIIRKIRVVETRVIFMTVIIKEYRE